MKRSESLYTENQDIIEIKAKKFTRMYPEHGYNEFLSQANYTFVKCLDKKLNKEEFRKYLNISLDRELFRMVNKSLDFVEMTSSIQNKYSISKTSACLPFNEWVETLSDKGKELVKIVFTAPLKSISNNKRITISCLCDYLHRRKGWSTHYFKAAQWEIKKQLEDIYV